MNTRRSSLSRGVGARRLRYLVMLAALPVLALAYGASAHEQGQRPSFIEHFHSRPDLVTPVVTVTARRHTSPGYVFFAPKQLETGFPGTSASIQQGPEILDNDGEIVWFGPVPGSRTRPKDARPHATDFRLQTYKGQPVLTWWQGLSAFGHGDGTYWIVDGSYRKIAEVRPRNGVEGDEHDFVISPRGTALITFYKPVPRQDLSSVGGPKRGTVLDSGVQELDIATNRVLFEWHSLGNVELSESYAKPGAIPGQPFDYFHVNSIALEPDGDVLVSARNTHAIYEISHKTGKVLWRLGGAKSDFKLGEGAVFAWQHDARRQPDGTLTLFDNGAAPALEKYSRVLTLRLDTKAKTATLVRALAHPKRILSGSQGNAQFLPDGHVFVGWGANPNMTEFDENGKVVFDAHWTKGSDSYRAYRFPWVGRPTSAPDVAVTGEGNPTVWVSWNGATEVKKWQLLSGKDAASLQPVATAPKSGFETTIHARAKGDYLAVRALDAAGNALATSAVLHRSRSTWRRS